VTSISPSLTATTTYHAQARNNTTGCVSTTRLAVTGTVELPAAPTNASSNARCGSGTVTFSASVPNGYTIDWYTASTGIDLVSGGGSVTSISPSLTASTTYHAQARNTTTGCVSTTRLAVTGAVNPVPTINHVGTSGSPTQTVNLGTAISAISYTATNSATISMTGAFPTGVTGAPSGTSYTISGTPLATGMYGYSLTVSANGCTSAAAGTITVVGSFTTSTGGPNTAYTTTTWIIGTGSSAQTWSDRIATAVCPNTETISPDYTTAAYKMYNGLYYYSWACVKNNQTDLCPSGWRVPAKSDFDTLISNLGGENENAALVLIYAWGFTGFVTGSTVYYVGSHAELWSTTQTTWNRGYTLRWDYGFGCREDYIQNGLQVRCVR
jgi:uncharacterized protein (TIGR02145 family)